MHTTPKVLVLGLEATSDERLERCDVHELRTKLRGAAGLVLGGQLPELSALLGLARETEPPVQVLIISDDPKSTRRALRPYDLAVEVLREGAGWDEVLRRFGLERNV
ncbi:MAG: hypothetical protein KF901_16955 [Myxococcales bacterium]|nr:hypothetical protein [Myxococcales bacterium]